MPRGSKPGERRGGRQKGTPNKTVVAKAAHILAAPSFSGYIRLFELAEDCDRDLTVALAKRPQNPTEIAECRERLARTLKDLLPYEKPRLTTANVQGDKDYPLMICQRLATASWCFCATQYQGHNGGRSRMADNDLCRGRGENLIVCRG
jgi:hypothetical protein